MPEREAITDIIRNALPEALRDDPALKGALQQVANLESEHVRHALERRFLERASREGLLYPGDALKLEDVTGALGDEAGLDRLFRELRARRPYLFSKPPAAPEKLASRKPENEGIRQAWRGGLTRQVQIARDALRRR
ncbi:MAG: hypothetical protein KF696_08535 [Planctomycetes bacterium]|nr:hypothetical protein [Planctomycetota bacterium]MCW8135603.1 hypothetical protein [Planctomycetota bacterium]